MKISKSNRSVKALAPAIALGALLLVTMIFENAAPTAVVQSLPEEGMDCYCHKGLLAEAQVNDTGASGFQARVEEGKSFTLLVELDFSSTVSPYPYSVGWMPDMDDNSKFKFDPNQIGDNTPLDRSPAAGVILALFKLTAPNQTGTYTLAFTYQGSISEIFVSVGRSRSLSYAAIARVNGPLASLPGDMVRMNVTLRNNGTEASKFYIYATNGSSHNVVFPKVYSDAPVAGNATAVLNAEFQMPPGNLTLAIHSGHVEDGDEVDDARRIVYMFQSLPAPLVPRIPMSVLATQWAPWIAITAASLAAVPLLEMHARRRRLLSSEVQGRLRLAIVDCAICGGCEVAIADLGEQVLSLLSDRVELVYAPILMSAREFGSVDVVFVVGAVRNEDDLRAVREAREKAKVLVAFGTCPGFGGVNTLSNLYSKEELLDSAYVNALSMKPNGGEKTVPSVRVPGLLNEIKPLSEYVKVDVTLPGCPPPLQVIRDALDALLQDVSAGVEVKK
jgi:coenzyme F420-reducing hydrogenase gamma subunit